MVYKLKNVLRGQIGNFRPGMTAIADPGHMREERAV